MESVFWVVKRELWARARAEVSKAAGVQATAAEVSLQPVPAQALPGSKRTELMPRRMPTMPPAHDPIYDQYSEQLFRWMGGQQTQEFALPFSAPTRSSCR